MLSSEQTSQFNPWAVYYRPMSAPNGICESRSDRTVTRSWWWKVGSAAPVTERAAAAHDVTVVVAVIAAAAVEADRATGTGCVAMISPKCGDVQGTTPSAAPGSV